jgi:predicted AAA+ superfamily ATPase
MIERNTYIQQIVPFIDKPQVKIITGIRRSGKSFVLRLLLEELTNKGIKPKQVISVNFESFEYADLLNAKAVVCLPKTANKKQATLLHLTR